MIQAPAIKHKGIIYTLPQPARHMNIYARVLVKNSPSTKYGEGEYGFLTDAGAFLDRFAAGKHALECGQVESLNAGNELYTEELY